jgi:ribose 5-phosphate isomerase B
MEISIGCDHAGWELKQHIKEYLHSLRKLDKVMINDRGCYNEDSCDYADYAHLVSEDVQLEKSKFGILICGSGNGINMTANKWKEIRSALCWNSEIAKMSRLHNDANILTLPGRYISVEEAIECVDIFLNTKFEGGRHKRRIIKINKNEKQSE